jgi:hypothetical protein
MQIEILFETSRFNVSVVKEHFINPCCFGEDAASWLRAKLIEKGIATVEAGQEDWGWYIESTRDNASYFIGVGGVSNESPANADDGAWRLMVERHRTTWDKLRGKNKISPDDPILAVIREILENESDFKDVRVE